MRFLKFKHGENTQDNAQHARQAIERCRHNYKAAAFPSLNFSRCDECRNPSQQRNDNEDDTNRRKDARWIKGKFFGILKGIVADGFANDASNNNVEQTCQGKQEVQNAFDQKKNAVSVQVFFSRFHSGNV